MLVNENPGTCGAAARLPKKPGSQKLTPTSSARELVGVDTTRVPASGTATTLAATRSRRNDRTSSARSQEGVVFMIAPCVLPTRRLWRGTLAKADWRDYKGYSESTLVYLVLGNV